MANYISREAAAKQEKIKTPFARIIVNNNPEKTYYNIMWWQDGEMQIGFGSASLLFVRKWLSEEFEVESPAADVELVRHGRWEGYTTSRFSGFDKSGEPMYRDGTVWYCSNRKCRRRTVIRERYCPSCGAKMDLEGEKNDN